MLLSKGTTLLRAANALKKPPTVMNHVVRNSSHDWYYREAAPPQNEIIKYAEFVGGFAWWWVLWHLWTEPGHVVGEFDYVDPSKWTDEELGIAE